MRTFCFLMLFSTLCLAQQTGTPATSSVEGIRAFVRISDSLGTSGQPKPEQFATIKDAGYRVVINLAPSDVRDAVKEEQQIVEGLGLKYIYIPVVWAEPKVEDAEKFFAAMKAHKDQKVFVHCIANMRVSAFTYLYRTTQLGVSEEDARKDLQKIWTPSGTWQQFISTVKAQQQSGSSFSGSVKKTFINPDGIAKSPYYSHAVAVEGGKTIYISGQVALNAEGQLVGKGDLRAQTV
ncbi:MAG TPA: sulfur transferase domain-containing protein, partial [Blastocatellia bacterium]|nr:sulfur transferase domain-containing protein [Blastocatellia bacterium]